MEDRSRTGRAVWDAHAEADPLWAVLSFPEKKGRRWSLPEFMQTGEREIALLFHRAGELGLRIPAGPVLDFGCGVGRLTQALGRRRPDVVGVDISPVMIDLASRLNQYPDRVRYLAASGLHAFGSGSIALIYSNIVLQHVEPRDAVQYLREFFRILQPHGVAIFQLPSHRAVARQEIQPMPDDAYRASIRLARPVMSSVAAGSELEVWLQVQNTSSRMWSQPENGPMAVGNHWLHRDGRMLLQDDARAPLLQHVPPGMEWPVMIRVRAPEAPGRHLCELDLVHEGVTWFAHRGSTPVRFEVEVTAALEPSPHSRIPMMEYPLPAYEEDCLRADPRADEPVDFAMNAVPHAEVIQLIRENGAELAHIEEDRRAGPAWVSYRYWAVRA